MDPICFSHEALSRLFPMHLVLAADGTVVEVGPTTRKLFPDGGCLGGNFFEMFEVHRPYGLHNVADIVATNGEKLHLFPQKRKDMPVKGVAVPCGAGGGVLVNLSFGISVVDAVTVLDLSSADFARTDLAVEMLYLVEAKSAAMSESHKLNSRLQVARIAAQEQAFTDTLTGLKNRRATDYVLQRFIETGRKFGLMHLDLDYFKDVNDTLGHAAGDHVLREVAHILVDEIRSDDLVARVGGDEFVLVFDQITNVDRLNEIAARLIDRLKQPIPFSGDICRISASIGTTVSDIYSPVDIDQMLADADVALYASKHKGRACYTVYDERLSRDGSITAPPKGRATRPDTETSGAQDYRAQD